MKFARRINNTGTVYAQDIEKIKRALGKIWQLQSVLAKIIVIAEARLP